MKKPYRCKGSYTQGTACANVDLPKGVTECVRCTERGYGDKERKTAVVKEKERVKKLPGDRVKKR